MDRETKSHHKASPKGPCLTEFRGHTLTSSFNGHKFKPQKDKLIIGLRDNSMYSYYSLLTIVSNKYAKQIRAKTFFEKKGK